MMRHGMAIAQTEEMVDNQISLPPGSEKEWTTLVVQWLTAASRAI